MTLTRHRVRCCSLAAFLVIAAPVAADDWVPVDCSDRAAEVSAFRRERGEGEVNSAEVRYRKLLDRSRAGDPLYVPHPFPSTGKQVLTDVSSALLRVEAQEGLLPAYRALIADLRDGELRGEVAVVQDWTLLRCVRRFPTSSYFLVRLRNEDGRERSRVVLKESGVLASWGIYEGQAPRLTSPAQVKEVLAELGHAHLPVQDAQYVTTAGLLRPCPESAPCVAFRSGAVTYILGHGPVLYRIDDEIRRSLHEHRRIGRQRGIRLGADASEPLWVSVGFEVRRAYPVAGRP